MQGLHRQEQQRELKAVAAAALGVPHWLPSQQPQEEDSREEVALTLSYSVKQTRPRSPSSLSALYAPRRDRQCCGDARGKGGHNSSRMQRRICESLVEMLMDWDGGGQRVKTGARKAPAQRCRMLMAETEMGLGVTGSAPS
ncbi:hypothetical protein cyc_04935 [Cyclospora cayetanensis]|uniref:Uncharacterized protein n=1 Tax=Cyclospora cayetanensis TaxID=88456 RepID=A0A1D3CZ65_9EIME|nr:hypothetical protein cyc_04935 [Cyclospora cayetanensis]